MTKNISKAKKTKAKSEKTFPPIDFNNDLALIQLRNYQVAGNISFEDVHILEADDRPKLELIASYKLYRIIAFPGRIELRIHYFVRTNHSDSGDQDEGNHWDEDFNSGFRAEYLLEYDIEKFDDLEGQISHKAADMLENSVELEMKVLRDSWPYWRDLVRSCSAQMDVDPILLPLEPPFKLENIKV